jgi:putative aldouronate transport system permease protein
MMSSEDRIASVVPQAPPELAIVSPRASVRSPRVWGRRYRQRGGLMMMMLPVLGYFLLFNYVPMAGQVIAFKDYVMSDGVFGSTWVGLDNFRRLFDSSDFPRVIRNTLTISLLRLAFGFFAPCLLALLLHELRLAWYRRTIQTLTYLPYFFSWVILGGIFSMLLSGAGPVNRMIMLISARPVNFLTDDRWFVAVLVLTGIWQSAGWGSVLYLAALVGVDPGLYEAARIDGANRWQQMRHITLPALTPTMLTLFILSLSGILSAGFDQVYNLYNPMVYDVADIIDTYVLRRMMDLDFGLAAAAGMFKSVVGLVLIVMANSVVGKLTHGEEGIY